MRQEPEPGSSAVVCLFSGSRSPFSPRPLRRGAAEPSISIWLLSYCFLGSLHCAHISCVILKRHLFKVLGIQTPRDIPSPSPPTATVENTPPPQASWAPVQSTPSFHPSHSLDFWPQLFFFFLRKWHKSNNRVCAQGMDSCIQLFGGSSYFFTFQQFVPSRLWRLVCPLTSCLNFSL